MNKDTFFPDENYKVPTTSNYMKFVEGKNKFRVLSSAIVGYEYWTKDNKPMRSAEPFEGVPEDIKTDKDGKYNINHFWAFIVWNYEAKRVQILELTQKGLMNYIQSLVNDEVWGNPKGYDLVVTRKGSGMDTEYTAVANPHSPVEASISDQFGKMKIDLNALFSGADPFSVDKN